MHSRKGDTIGQIYIKLGLLTLLAAIATASIVTLASSLSRHPLHALLIGAVLIAAQCLPAAVFENGRRLGDFAFLNHSVVYYIVQAFIFLPSIVLVGVNTYFLEEPSAFFIISAMAGLIAALCFIFTYKAFLAQRRV
jgi:hypothetical protein